MFNYQYTADDGITYQLTQPDVYSAAGAGDLPAAGGSELLWPAFWSPRFMRCVDVTDVTGNRMHIICDQGNSNWVLGPGQTFAVGLQTVVILDCIGERRVPL